MLHLHLQSIVEPRDTAANLDDIAALVFSRDAGVGWIPYPPFHLPGLVAQDQIHVWLVDLGSPQLLMQNQEKSVKYLGFFHGCQIGDVDVLHAAGRIQQSAELTKTPAFS